MTPNYIYFGCHTKVNSDHDLQRKNTQNVKIGVIWSNGYGHTRSFKMSPFDTQNTTFYSSFIETKRPSCTVYKIQRATS